MVHEWALSVNNAAKKVNLGSGESISYDKLVISPGIDLKFESVNAVSYTHLTLPTIYSV